MTELAKVTPGLSPAEAEQHALAAVEAVEHVDSPEQAEELLRRITAYQQAVRLAKIGEEQEQRWAAIRLQAERKMGDLLGEPEHGGDRKSDQVSAEDLIPKDEREVRLKARKVAAVPDEVFDEYLKTAEMPTRAGLLRTYSPPKASPEPEYTTCPTCGHKVRADQPLRPRTKGAAP